jgi:tRNA(fMet)-specific endonuclease VapC
MVLVDTDVFIDYFRGVEAAKEFMEDIPIDERTTTDITLMELFKGARNEDERENIEKFIEQNFFTVLPVSTTSSRTAVQILKRYAFKGLSLPDAIIAGIAISADSKLVSGNIRHFEFIERLKVELLPYRGR